MAVSEITEIFPAGIQEVWSVVTSLDHYEWRSDLSRIEVLNETQFVEYTKTEVATTFTVTRCQPCRRWEFDMENAQLKGHWTGVFTEKDGQTEIHFIEEVTAKSIVLRPFVKSFLRKQQKQYAADLRKALS